LAGAALPLAFAPFQLSLLAVLSTALLFMLWLDTAPRRAFFRGWLFGVGMFGVGVSWVHVSFFEFGNVSLPLSLSLTALFAASLALYPALLGYLVNRLFHGRSDIAQRFGLAVLFPAGWTLFEWLRGWLFTGFPWLNLGYSQVDTPLRGLAPLLGVYGVSLAVAVAGAVTATVFQALSLPINDNITIAVCSAAVMERRPLAEVAPPDWDRVMNLNLRGTFFVAKGAGAAMAEQGGAIVTLADVAAFQRWRNYPVHVISKAGVVAATELLAKSLAPKVRVNAVAPGAVLLPEGWDDEARRKLVATTPLGRLGTPDDVVRAVLFLLENDYLTGTTLVVDGGRLLR